MQKDSKNTASKRSGEDRRKVHTFLLQQRRLGPYCRRHTHAILNDKDREPKYWDWRAGQWKPLR